MKELITKDKKAARTFGYVWRYIDDLSAVNDDKIFENNIHNIYPPELELKKENTGYLSASFLNIDITIVNDKFSLKPYDNRMILFFLLSECLMFQITCHQPYFILPSPPNYLELLGVLGVEMIV